MIKIYDTLSHLAKTGYITNLAYRGSFDYINTFLKKCYYVDDKDDIIDNIYKSYVCLGTQSKAKQYLNGLDYRIPIANTVVNEDDIRHALVHHCCSDFDLTIVAKMMYSDPHHYYNIDSQINILLRDRQINIVELYKNSGHPRWNSDSVFSMGSHDKLCDRGYAEWERNGLYEYGDNGKLIMPN